ncbi:DUF3267 domain-containing protein [Paenibacillus pinisoli]|uniref:DUF3267 domain-containing protein n=1 Tax=Paenibacillus pinisoli TaxID=1276110 RepID=A0A3A6PH06_9BACL|nr:DUF3267 domain-containing protein [Paenibacillus pinisoli]
MEWFEELPPIRSDISQWSPFIRNDWFRRHYMKFVYVLMAGIFAVPVWYNGGFSHVEDFPLLLIIIPLFIMHELLHIIVIHRQGDISLTFKGIFFWLNSDAVLSKRRFWVFMSLPFIVLSLVPLIASLWVSGEWKQLLFLIGWINLIISSSDIINSLLILYSTEGIIR